MNPLSVTTYYEKDHLVPGEAEDIFRKMEAIPPKRYAACCTPSGI